MHKLDCVTPATRAKQAALAEGVRGLLQESGESTDLSGWTYDEDRDGSAPLPVEGEGPAEQAAAGGPAGSTSSAAGAAGAAGKAQAASGGLLEGSAAEPALTGAQAAARELLDRVMGADAHSQGGEGSGQ